MPSAKSSPPVAAAIAIYVPHSMRSGISLISAACSRFTPFIYMVPVPSPLISAPQPLRYSARHTISGSLAQFRMQLAPSAHTAAITAFSVAPTLGNLKVISAPESLSARHIIFSPVSSASAPKALITSICMSTGLLPM